MKDKYFIQRNSDNRFYVTHDFATRQIIWGDQLWAVSYYEWYATQKMNEFNKIHGNDYCKVVKC